MVAAKATAGNSKIVFMVDLSRCALDAQRVVPGAVPQAATDMKDFRWGGANSVTLRFLHISLLSFSSNCFASQAGVPRCPSVCFYRQKQRSGGGGELSAQGQMPRWLGRNFFLGVNLKVLSIAEGDSVGPRRNPRLRVTFRLHTGTKVCSGAGAREPVSVRRLRRAIHCAFLLSRRTHPIPQSPHSWYGSEPVPIAFNNVFCASAATSILIALFDAFVLTYANKPIECSWQSRWLTALLTRRPTKVATVALVNDFADDLGDDDRG
jgi:hypothetical protein